jgi:hypothetical protein
MRTMLVFVIFISFMPAKAQTALPVSSLDSIQAGTYRNNSRSIESAFNKKWSFITYSGISTGYNFFRGGNAFVVAAPLGLQLNRRLNNNFFAFAGISAAPAYINFNSSFLSAGVNKFNQNNGLYKTNSFGIYSRAELGLMYVNDARTFSISGSIGVERSSNPILYYQPVSSARANPLMLPNR